MSERGECSTSSDGESNIPEAFFFVHNPPTLVKRQAEACSYAFLPIVPCCRSLQGQITKKKGGPYSLRVPIIFLSLYFPKIEAFVSLATNDSYSRGALALGKSIQDTGSNKRLALMVSSGVSKEMR